MLAHSWRAAAVALIAVSACSQQAPQAEPEATPPPAATTATAPPPAAAAPVALEVKDAAGAQLTGDATAGARVWRQCQTCHVTDAGVNKVGPSLHAIIGRKAGTVEGFRYSAANQGSGITWTEQELYAYLENPRAKIPGTTMSFVGVKDSQQRADLIAYLKANAS